MILDKLLFFVLSPNANIRNKCLDITCRVVLRVTNLLSNQNDPHKRNRLLTQYTRFACNLPTNTLKDHQQAPLFHEQLLVEWLHLINNSKQNRRLKELLMHTSWFFFEILIKSISLHLNSTTHCFTNKNTNQFTAYKSKFSLNMFCTKSLSQKFISDLEVLINQIPLKYF